MQLTEAKKKLHDEREKTQEGKIENRKQELEELQEQNATLARKFYGLGGMLNKKPIARNTLAIENLTEEIGAMKYDYEGFKANPAVARREYKEAQQQVAITKR